MRTAARLGSCSLLIALLGGCAMNTIVADSSTGVLEEAERSFRAERSWRHAREAGPGLLKLLDAFIASSPDNEMLLLSGARLNALFAFAFVEAEDEDWARVLYDRAAGYGLRALDDERLDAALGTGRDAVVAALNERDVDDVEPLFWTGVALSGRINLSRDSIRAVADLPEAIAFVERVRDLDESFFHGGPHLFLGRYHGSRGRELGGDPDAARASFERALALTDNRMLLAKVWLARYHAVPLQDRARYERLLEEVLDAPDDLLVGDELATAIAKHAADRLLLDIDDYFLE